MANTTSALKVGKLKVAQVLSQARESLKFLGAFEKKALAKAKSFVKIPNAADRKRLRNDRILSSLRKLGVATQQEVASLTMKIEKLETVFGPKKSSTKAVKNAKKKST